ncbi:MAG: heavy metal translocating P-type ATPase [Halanaeroarchaeum sp.]
MIGVPSDWRRTYRKHRTALVTGTSGLLYAGGWSLGYLTGLDRASAAILVLAAVVGGYDIAKTAYHEVASRTLGIKTLVTLAAIGAIAIGEYWEAAAVVFLFSLGSYLEGRTMRKTRTALEELLEMTPDTATVRRDGELVEVPAREVETGETVVVRPGEKIPVDGEVVDGESAVNQAPVTGESAPVHKADGDEVYAGTVNQEGALEVHTTGAGSDTTLQRIIRRVEEAQEAKAPTESLIDRFATYYTPAIVVLAVGAYAVTGNAMLALTLLVIGCPGALVIGPPVSIVSAIGNAARNGVLMKGGEHLETAGTIDLVAFDKTGTLTRGETTVADVHGPDRSDASVLRLAAIAEKKSEHHLADAILAAVDDRDGLAADDGGVAPDGGAVASVRGVPDPDDFDVVAGKGVVAHHDGREIVVGNRSLFDERGLDIPDAVADYVHERESMGETPVHVAIDGETVGAIALKDEVRETAPGVVADLEASGVRTVMLTGDNERTARAVGESVGIDDVRAELLPEDKQRVVEDLREDGTVVAMVGDGINDAPSLATADVGIAMGAAGTDTAIETADMALMADDLERIPYAVSLSKATRWNVYENVGIAVLTVSLLLAGVLTDLVHLAGGMLVHEGSVLVVILNGMRLLRY